MKWCNCIDVVLVNLLIVLYIAKKNNNNKDLTHKNILCCVLRQISIDNVYIYGLLFLLIFFQYKSIYYHVFFLFSFSQWVFSSYLSVFLLKRRHRSGATGGRKMGNCPFHLKVYPLKFYFLKIVFFNFSMK